MIVPVYVNARKAERAKVWGTDIRPRKVNATRARIEPDDAA